MNDETLETWVARAVSGDAAALDRVLRAVKDDVYGLAIRMLMHPADAEDATQEILLRVVTRLSTFEGRARFRTWVYRLAVRALLNFRRGRAEPTGFTFEAFSADLLDGLQAGAPEAMPPAEKALLEREVRIACTQAMLLCLDRNHRMAYLLGVIFELDGPEAAECLEVSEATYRKRLSRARTRVEAFTQKSCGIVNDAAACRCAGRIGRALATGRVQPATLLFAEHPVREVAAQDAEHLANALAEACRSDALMRGNPNYLAPDRLLSKLRQVSRRL